jgi:hypothetical protein
MEDAEELKAKNYENFLWKPIILLVYYETNKNLRKDDPVVKGISWSCRRPKFSF